MVILHTESHRFGCWAIARQCSGTGWLSMSQVNTSLRCVVLCHRVRQRGHVAPLLSRYHLGDCGCSPLPPFGSPNPAARQLHYRPRRFCCCLEGFVVFVILSVCLFFCSFRFDLFYGFQAPSCCQWWLLSSPCKGVFLTKKHMKRFRFLQVILPHTLPK